VYFISSDKSGESKLVERRARRRRLTALVLTAAMTVAACGDDTPAAGGSRSFTPTTSSTPFAGTTLQSGEVVLVDNLDGAKLRPVKDGIVRSFEISAEVTEFGTAEQLGTGDAAYRAEGDDRLLVFSMTTERTERETALDGDVVAAVTVDDKQRELPDFSSSSSSAEGTQASYAVAVPRKPAAVTLDLKYNGVVQSLDLLEGKPTGERPDALYRADRGTVVFQEGLAPGQFDVEVSTQTYTYTATVVRAELGYFPIQGHETPSTKDKGWLTLWVGSVAKPTTCVAPLAAYTLTAEDGTAYQATQSASKIPEPGLLDSPLSIVAFEVPADLAEGTLTVTSPRVTCQTSTATYDDVPAHGAATIDITLPAS
jgi:hypothetical protein